MFIPEVKEEPPELEPIQDTPSTEHESADETADRDSQSINSDVTNNRPEVKEEDSSSSKKVHFAQVKETSSINSTPKPGESCLCIFICLFVCL